MLACCCQASGIIIITASCSVRPFISRNSSTLSKLLESEPFGCTTGKSLCRSSPKALFVILPSREFMELTLPSRVLISPLWLMNRLG